MGKSFWTGRFRESCGKEYFNGHDVSIVRVRQVFPTQLHDVTEVESLVSLRNQLYMSGYWQTCRWLEDKLRKLLRFYPTVLASSSVLGRVSFLGYETQRTDPYLHSPMVKGWRLEAKPPQDVLEGSGALLKCLLKLDANEWLEAQKSPPSRVPGSSVNGMNPMTGHLKVPSSAPEVTSKHLERSGRPKSSSMKLGWRSPL